MNTEYQLAYRRLNWSNLKLELSNVPREKIKASWSIFNSINSDLSNMASPFLFQDKLYIHSYTKLHLCLTCLGHAYWNCWCLRKYLRAEECYKIIQNIWFATGVMKKHCVKRYKNVFFINVCPQEILAFHLELIDLIHSRNIVEFHHVSSGKHNLSKV